jgi:hypothetical protein
MSTSGCVLVSTYVNERGREGEREGQTHLVAVVGPHGDERVRVRVGLHVREREDALAAGHHVRGGETHGRGAGRGAPHQRLVADLNLHRTHSNRQLAGRCC